MLYMKQPGSVVHRTVAIVVVADGTVEEVIAQDSVKGFALRRIRARR